MPRQPRLDAPGALHHVMGRGIERTTIFHTDQDREDFLDRLAALCLDGKLHVYAWSLLSNHFHLLVRTARQPISRSMRKLLTGYVVNFNLRHKRHGHLFQNRYKSIICEDDPYLLELTRYVAFDERVLGGDDFIQRLMSKAEEKEKETLRLTREVPKLSVLAKRIMRGEEVEESELRSGTRKREVVTARRLFCQLAIGKLGCPGAEVARFLGVTTSSVNRLAVSEQVGNLTKYLKLF